MNKTFICLANSYKHGNRCIAGIEIIYHPNTKTYDIVHSANGLQKWFRPVNQCTEGGAIPNSEALSINIFDIIEATEVAACPSDAQQENHYYRTLKIIDHAIPSIISLDDMCDNVHSTIFGNKGAAVHQDKIGSVNYSITLIKTSDVEFYLKDRTELGRVPQPKAKIKFHNATLDIPVTDPDFRSLMENNLDKANSFSVYYLVMSLGVKNEVWFSKLVAGVIPINV